LLSAPDSAAVQKWQRVDAWASLPPGTALEARYGWIDDADMRRAALRLQADTRLSQSQRLRSIEDLVDHWSAPIVFLGDTPKATSQDASNAPFSFPLQDARTTRLWLHLTLRAAPGAALPALDRMHLSYGQSPLLTQLPAVYRRTAEQPGDFLGALVGLMEATTQDLDRRIGGLGALVHPDTAPAPWLDEMAEWLGVPWDDALAEPQKRALLNSAARLGGQRGTHAGLATLLDCLFPGSPPRFRITDVDVDYGFISLGGGTCRGTALPAVLAGLPATATVLSRKTILGQALLPCKGQEPSATAHLAGNLRVDVTASNAERRAAQKWLAPLIDAMVPANLRIDLRWHLPQGASFGGVGELLAAPLPHLGVDAVTGFARLPRADGGYLST
jgi:phage tail-like protein